MGLDTSHDCWHGSYSSFATWRGLLAEAANLPTEDHPQHGHKHHVIQKEYHPRVYQGWWDEDPEDILDVLLVHSDCDGYIFPQHAEALAERLESLAHLMPGWWEDRTREFASGLRQAYDNWEIVVFH